MKIVRIVLVLAAIWLVLAMQGFEFSPALEPPPPADARAGAAIRQNEIEDLIGRRQSLSALAAPGHYTVVEVYLDSCAICRRLEAGFKSFTDKRADVTIQRVHFPEDGLEIAITGTTQAEAEAQARSVQALMESICGTPHVEVYGPDKRPIARDNCGDKQGTTYLRDWIAAETDLGDLLSGASSTPLPGSR